MSDMTVESLQLEVEVSSSQAATSIENLATTLGKLKIATKGLGLNGVSKQLGTLNTTLNSVNTTNADNLNKLANGIRTLSSCGNLKLSSSVATQITNLGNAVRSLDNTNFTALSSLATALTPLSNMGKANLNSFISQLQRLPQAVQALNGVEVSSLSAKIRELVSALAPLSQLGKNNLTSFVTQLKKLPEAVIALQSVNISQLASQIQQLANAFAPLATQMQSIANGFSALPTRLQRLIQQTNRLSTANGRASMSYINLWAKARMAYNAIRIGANVVAGWIRESHEYIVLLLFFKFSSEKHNGIVNFDFHCECCTTCQIEKTTCTHTIYFACDFVPITIVKVFGVQFITLKLLVNIGKCNGGIYTVFGWFNKWCF